MDGTSKYVNLKTGPGGNGMPPGEQVGDILIWDGSYWSLTQLSELIAGLLPAPAHYMLYSTDSVPDAIPQGHRLVHITLFNRESTSKTISLGLTDGGNELLDNETIDPHSFLDIPVNRFISYTSASPLYFDIASEILEDGFLIVVDTKFEYKP